MDLSTLSKPRTIAAIALSVLSLTALGSAIRFDYRRRHDPVFRQKLNKEARRVEKSGQAGRAADMRELSQTLTRALIAIRNEPGPQSNEEKESYFMDQVALGEQAAARSPDFYVASAICFFKALKVYPAPAELAQIYQKTQPPAVFALVMELLSLDAQLFSGPSDPRDRSDSALLEEIIDPVPSTILPSASTTAAAAATAGSENGSSTGNGSYVHVESETVVVESETVVLETEQGVVVEEKVVLVEVGEGEDPPESVAA